MIYVYHVYLYIYINIHVYIYIERERIFMVSVVSNIIYYNIHGIWVASCLRPETAMIPKRCSTSVGELRVSIPPSGGFLSHRGVPPVIIHFHGMFHEMTGKRLGTFAKKSRIVCKIGHGNPETVDEHGWIQKYPTFTGVEIWTLVCTGKCRKTAQQGVSAPQKKRW